MNFRNDIPVLTKSFTRSSLGCYQNDGIFNSSDDNAVYDLSIILSEDFKETVCFFMGATKAVFDIPQRDYVVKVPFNGGESDYASCYNSDEDSWCSSDCQFTKFLYADRNSGEGSSWDYCEQEAIIYNKAVQLGIGDMFAGTVKIAEANYYPIYASERAESYSQVDYGTTSSNETIRHIFADVKPYYPEDSELYKIGEQFMEECDATEDFSIPDRMNLEFLGYMINYYGKNKVLTLCDFLDKNCLNDFHSSNVGFIGDRPVLIDYSGFYEEC